MEGESPISLRAANATGPRQRDEDLELVLKGMARDITSVIYARRLKVRDIADMTGRNDNGRLREQVADIKAGRVVGYGFETMFRIAKGLGMETCGGVPIRLSKKAVLS